MSQEQYNFDTDYSIAQTKNITGAVSGFLSSVSNADLGIAAQTGSDLAINQMLLDKQSQNHMYYVSMMSAQKQKQQMLPNSANLGSSNSTLLGYDFFEGAIITEYRIKREFAEKIDKYFECYGYATNKIKIPNLNNRSEWNYVKTINANIVGKFTQSIQFSNIPQYDLERLKNMFDTGVTLWHNANHFLDYSYSNT